jgi:hypothetical protein
MVTTGRFRQHPYDRATAGRALGIAARRAGFRAYTFNVDGKTKKARGYFEDINAYHDANVGCRHLADIRLPFGRHRVASQRT